MKRLLNIASLVITAKALWWDKLSREDQERYVAKAKSFLTTHKGTITEKGKQFVADKKPLFDEKKEAAVKALKKNAPETEEQSGADTEKKDIPTPAEVAMKPATPQPASDAVV